MSSKLFQQFKLPMCQNNKAKYYRKKHNSVIVHARQVFNMQKSDILSVVLLCIINIIFMVAGIFLNSVVIISLWRSQLQKKLCYFMILVLSCSDLAVVTITHPFVIVSTTYFSSQGGINEIHRLTQKSIFFVVYGTSLIALFMLNVERFLALTCPFFHHASVTKTKLLGFQAFSTVISLGLSPSVYLNLETIVDICETVTVLSLLFLFIYSNYSIQIKVFIIAKSKRADERVAPTTAMDENRKTRILNLKNISTCSLEVGCFFCCFCPYIIYAALRLHASRTSFSERQFLLFYLWSKTFNSLNSTFNCVIFFWRNSILRREGMKILNAFRRRVNN